MRDIDLFLNRSVFEKKEFCGFLKASLQTLDPEFRILSQYYTFQVNVNIIQIVSTVEFTF